MSTLQFYQFIQNGNKLTHSIKSALGRINKTLAEIDEYLLKFNINE